MVTKVKIETDDSVHWFRHIACDSEYPEEGWLTLGNEIDFDE